MNTQPNGEHRFRFPIDVDAMTSEERAKLGALIRERRVAQGLTHVELALRSGVDRKTIRTIESGERTGHAGRLRALLEALNVPQADDVERSYSEATVSFIASTAPIFDQLPTAVQAEAHGDVVTLLAGKLMRASQDDYLAAASERTDDEAADEGFDGA